MAMTSIASGGGPPPRVGTGVETGSETTAVAVSTGRGPFTCRRCPLIAAARPAATIAAVVRTTASDTACAPHSPCSIAWARATVWEVQGRAGRSDGIAPLA